MQVQTRQGPAYGVARLTLAPNEPVRVEWRDDGDVDRCRAAVEGRGRHHEVAEARRTRWRELLRQHVHRAAVRVASSTSPHGFPGDITTHEVSPGHALFVQKGSWLANEVNVTIDAQWGGFKNLFGGEGGFIIRAEGQGHRRVRLLRRAGGVEPAGRSVDHHRHRHMVAYEDTVQMQMRKASGGGLVQSFKSGEGYVFDFTGPGRVWTQTRNPTELMGWIQSFVGTGNSSGTSLGGAFGGLLGRD